MTTNTLTKDVTTRDIDWAAQVRKSWGDEFHKPEPGYEFSNGRKFVTPKEETGVYNP